MVSKKSKESIKWIEQLTLVILLVSVLLAMSRTTHAVPNGGYIHPEIMIQPEGLKTLIEKRDPGVRIVDVREKLQYLSGHIPGAVQIWRSDIEDKSHPIPGMMASQSQVEELLGKLGINNKNTAVIYSDGPDSARLWWVLAYYGFPIKQMKLLDGGLDGWKAKGYPTEMVPPTVKKTIFKFPKETRNRSMLCTLSDVKGALKRRDKAVLDVRSKREYTGEEMKKGATRGGRIPEAVWVEWKETMVEEGPYKGYWKPAKEIKQLFSANRITPDRDIYIY